MKLLPKKIDIDKAKAAERKIEIDNGLALARKVDALREAKLKEEQNLREWRDGSIKAIQQEIDSYLEVRDNLKKDTEKLAEDRKELLKPLTKEWSELNIAKEEVRKDKDLITKSKESLREEASKIKSELEKASKIVSRVTKAEEDAEKAKSESIALKQLAQSEYEIARGEHESQTDTYERRMSEVAQLEKQYLAGISTNEIEARTLKEKESELITKEQDLERQRRILQIARQEIEKHGYHNDADNQ